MSKATRLLLLGALALLGGCGDATGPRVALLTGTWTYSVPDIKIGLQHCAITDVTLALEQSGSTLTGTTSGGTSTCVNGKPQPVPSFPISQGRAVGGRVTFTIADAAVRNDGMLSGNTVTGTATFHDEFGQAVVEAAFTMVRQ